MDCIVHGILQARVLEWVAFPFSRGFPDLGIEPRFPTLQVDSLPSKPQGKLRRLWHRNYLFILRSVGSEISFQAPGCSLYPTPLRGGLLIKATVPPLPQLARLLITHSF